MRKLLTIATMAGLTLNGQASIAGADDDCGFATFGPTEISQFAARNADVKVTPTYPPAAEARGLGGTVRVRILVNKSGLVERTCPLFVGQEERPDRTLVIAAEAAALLWKFVPNFGIVPAAPTGITYVQDVIAFEFNPQETKTGTKAGTASN